MEIFGFEIKKKSEEKEYDSFVAKTEDDGAINIAQGGVYGTYVDLDGAARTEAELISKYREVASQPEVEYAVDEIVNETIAADETKIVTIDTDSIEGYSDNVKKAIRDEFDNISEMLDINNIGYEIFRRFYIDGRLSYHVIIDEEKPSEGIKELRYVDPRKIRKVREIKKERQGQITLQKVKNEYYVYNDKGFTYAKNTPGSAGATDTNVQGLKIATDSVINITSGLMNENNTLVLSYLHKAIRPMNQLRTLEDAVVIYRISRAPERRIFYIDVGNLPKAKAEQYLRDMMVKHKNRLVYDASTGQVRDDRKHMTMLEDFWLPRREGGRGTEITTLPGGQNLGEMEDVNYFLQKLYKALNIPVSRLETGQGFNIGRSSEITRDEVKFQKFITRLRKRFSLLFYRALEKQLVLKNIISEDEWPSLSNGIYFEFATDNFFTEMKNSEIMMSRIELADRLQSYIGEYYSKDWVRKNVLMLTDQEIEQLEKEMDEPGQDNQSENPAPEAEE